VGFAEAGNLVPPEMASGLGISEPQWFCYVASPLAGGEWAERAMLTGKAASTGLVGALQSGGQRPLMAALPASTFLAFSANVADGPQFCRGLEPLCEVLGVRSAAIYMRRLAELNSGSDFDRDIAAHLRGELTAGWLVPRGGAYPQVLLGAGLADSGAARLSPILERIMSSGSGQLHLGTYRGIEYRWLVNRRLSSPMLPSPAYCFKGDRLVLSSASVHLKELIAGRGGRWLSADCLERLSRGMLAVRLSLGRALPYAVGLARQQGLFDRLAEEARAALPPVEDVSEHLGDLEVVLERCPQGTRAELRSPLPVGAVLVAALLVAG
jgi:hypothetical protein